jgi:peptidoglycan/xylan/chitin deacetylase (PgdA/CDA1 family)
MKLFDSGKRHHPTGAARVFRGAALPWIIRAGYYSGALSALKRRGFRTHRGLIVLMYHSVGESPLLHRGLSVSAANFERQLEYLTRRFEIVSLARAVEIMRRGAPLPESAVALTFDDGFRDNYETAFPILKKYRCPATVFVATEPLVKRVSLWPYRLMFWMKRTAALRLEFSPGELPGAGQIVFALRTARRRRRALRAIEPSLWRAGRAERERLLGVIAEKLGVDPANDPADDLPMLAGDQLRELADAGIDIGSHTVSHPSLAALAREEALGELTESKTLLESKVGRPVKFFAYPFGGAEHCNAATERLVREAGYEAACTTIRGVNRSGTDLFRILRVGVENDPAEIFAFKLSWYR